MSAGPCAAPTAVPAPSRSNNKKSACEGQAGARWTRVPNAQFYEVKTFSSTADDNPETIPCEGLAVPSPPCAPSALSSLTNPAGSCLTIRARAIGSKGPSQWTETAAVRVYWSWPVSHK